jgi:hypothetical protein
MLMRLVRRKNTELNSGAVTRIRESRHSSPPDTNNGRRRKTKSSLRELAKGGEENGWAIVAPPKFYCYIFTGDILEKQGEEAELGLEKV